MHKAVATTRMMSNQLVHAPNDGMLIVLYLGAITLRAARLAQHHTQTTLRNLIMPQFATHTLDRRAASRGADQFGRAASLRIMMSKA